MASDSERGTELTAADREWLAEIKSAESLTELVHITGADTEHEAYFDAKRQWRNLRGKELSPPASLNGIPGDRVVIDGNEFYVHGITHANTDAEREFLHEHVSQYLEAGAAVYCEQGIRTMYFPGLPAVCEMDDYRWAMNQCAELETGTRLNELSEQEFDGLVEEITVLSDQFQTAVFSLIESGDAVYGEGYTKALGDIASYFLTSHEDLATGTDFTSFSLSRQAALAPENLGTLQNYYKKAFLPQPVEREWLRRHDPELEIVTHARNERMADYAVFHEQDASNVHLIVGAAHQPGITYYLDQHRVGNRELEEFEPIE